ncbi:UNVERIFIED_CONTAM: spore germination protein KB [Brevibacillus sp. OAP136]
MLDNEKITAGQFRDLVILYTVGTSILVIPSFLAFYSQQDAWLTAIFGVILCQGIIFVQARLGLSMPTMTFVQMNEYLLGKWLGKCTSSIFLILPFLYSGAVLYYIGKFISTQFFAYTPPAFIHLLIASVLFLAVYLGVETFTRAAGIFLTFFYLLFIILVVLISPQIHSDNLFPIFGTGIKPMINATLTFAVYSSVDAVVLLMIYPAHVRNQRQAYKSYFVGNAIGGFIILVITILCVLVLGGTYTANQMFPSYLLAQKVNIGNFIQRIEAILALMWFVSTYYKLVLYFFGTCLGVSQVLGLRDYKPLVLPIGILVIYFSLTMYPNVVYQQEWDTKTSVPLSFSIDFCLPVLLLILYAVRKRKLKPEKG